MNASAVHAKTIPADLRRRKQWIVWREVPKPDGKIDKVPVDPSTGRNLDPHDRRNWMNFEPGMRHAPARGGIGFVLTADDPYAVVDLDDALDDTGTIALHATYARQIVDRLDSYTEVSHSKGGLHIFVRGTLPAGRREAKGVEVYDRGRFIAMTGDVFEGRDTIHDRQTELEDIFHRFVQPHEARGTYEPPEAISEGQRHNEIVRLAGALRARGLTPDEIEAALLAVNRARCGPPLADGEVRVIA
ncbi:MAG: primase C-terminal domain-containing protein, partial [bacterium]